MQLVGDANKGLKSFSGSVDVNQPGPGRSRSIARVISLSRHGLRDPGTVPALDAHAPSEAKAARARASRRSQSQACFVPALFSFRSHDKVATIHACTTLRSVLDPDATCPATLVAWTHARQLHTRGCVSYRLKRGVDGGAKSRSELCYVCFRISGVLSTTRRAVACRRSLQPS